MTLTDLCSKCGENGMNCKCDQFHPNIEKEYGFTLDELKTLFHLFEHEWISYENVKANEVLNKIIKIIRSTE